MQLKTKEILLINSFKYFKEQDAKINQTQMSVVNVISSFKNIMAFAQPMILVPMSNKPNNIFHYVILSTYDFIKKLNKTFT
jgi:hypothetical protein